MAKGNSFDYYVRSLTTALLAVGLVGAAVYSILFRAAALSPLLGWAGIVVGIYFGGHAVLNGRRSVMLKEENVEPVPDSEHV